MIYLDKQLCNSRHFGRWIFRHTKARGMIRFGFEVMKLRWPSIGWWEFTICLGSHVFSLDHKPYAEPRMFSAVSHTRF